MSIDLLNIAWYEHYKLLEILTIEISLGDWRGSLLFLEWHEGDFMWDFMFINGKKMDVVG